MKAVGQDVQRRLHPDKALLYNIQYFSYYKIIGKLFIIPELVNSTKFNEWANFF